MIEITEKTVAIWYIQLTQDSDFMGALQETAPRTFEFNYRFRYYTDDKAFESEDVKNWYHLLAKDTERDEILVKVKNLLLVLAAASGQLGYYEFINDNGIDDLMERFTKAPFAHTQNLGRPN